LRGCPEGRSRELHRKDPPGPESRIDVLERPQASDQETGAGQQNDRQREFRHYESAPDPARGHSAREASSSFLVGGPQVAARHGYRRRQSNQDSCQEAKGQSPAEHLQVEAGLVQTSQVPGLESQNEADPRQGYQQPRQPRYDGQSQTFGQQLADDPRMTGSERGSNGDFLFAAGTASQREACDVGRGDEEHTKNVARQHPQCQPRPGSG